MEKLCINKVSYYLISYLTIQNVVGAGKVQKKSCKERGMKKKKRKSGKKE